MPSDLDARERAIRLRFQNDMPHFAARCLKVRSKTGKVVPFVLNTAQRYLHAQLERQLRETGKVRALVLKGRQEGVSTYVAGRFFHKAIHSKGQRVYILTHDSSATENLFEFVDRFMEHLPSMVKPSTGRDSTKELDFDKLDSGYKVATAGSKGAGRSQTIQLFHGSEVAFWPHADQHAAGALEAVPDMAGTEVILESTANGMGNLFHENWQLAEAGGSDYQAIFIPWFVMPEYRRPVPEGFEASPEEAEYAETNGLDLEQIVWRRNKIADLKDETLFKQEYPANPIEAFQLSGHDSYIPARLVTRARMAKVEGVGPLILGVDPSRGESARGDRFSIAMRRGRKVFWVKSYQKIGDGLQGAGLVKKEIDILKPARVFVDVGGVGASCADILKNWYGPELIRLVNFGADPVLPPPDDGGGPRNRRAEMWQNSKLWLQDQGGADIPDSDSLQADACAPSYHYDVAGRLLMESKEHMIKVRKVRSPDEWDAIALTFAEPVVFVRTPASGPGNAAGGDQTVGY